VVPNDDVSVTISELRLAGAEFLGSDLPSYLGSLQLNDFKTLIPDLQDNLQGAPPYGGSLLKDAPHIINTVESFIGQHPSETLGSVFSVLSADGVPAVDDGVFVTIAELRLAGSEFLGSDLPGYLGSIPLNDSKNVISALQHDLKGAPPYNGSLLKDASYTINNVSSFIGQHPSETLGSVFSILSHS
jgi:hypothetical protein